MRLPTPLEASVVGTAVAFPGAQLPPVWLNMSPDEAHVTSPASPPLAFLGTTIRSLSDSPSQTLPSQTLPSTTFPSLEKSVHSLEDLAGVNGPLRVIDVRLSAEALKSSPLCKVEDIRLIFFCVISLDERGCAKRT